MPQRNISSDLLSAIIAEVPSLQVFIKITATDATVIGFTRNASAVTYSGVTYLAAPGLSVTQVSSGLGLNVDNLETGGAFLDGVLTESQVRSGKWDFATYELFILDLDNLASGKMIVQTGRIREIRISDNAFTAELASLSQLLQQNVGELTSAKCRVKQVGDSLCKLNLEAGTHPTYSLPYKATITVHAVTDHVTFNISSLTYPSGFFNNGLLVWQTGANAGVRCEVKQQINDTYVNTFVLQEPPNAGSMVAGDTEIVYWGCNHTFVQCQSVQNVKNFRGEPYLPGQKLLLTSK